LAKTKLGTYNDKIKHDGYVHYVYYKTPEYWLVSRYRVQKMMFSVLVSELSLSDKQKEGQRQILIKRLDDAIKERNGTEKNFSYNNNGELDE